MTSIGLAGTIFRLHLPQVGSAHGANAQSVAVIVRGTMGDAMSATTRRETDGFGAIDVPADALWGAQTERSRRFFAIGEQRMPLAVIHAIAEIKRAAAEVNHELGLLDGTKARAIARRCGAGRCRRVRCAVSAVGVADRLGHTKPHERQRGGGQSRLARARRRDRAETPGASERRRQSGPIIERRVPCRDARGSGAADARPARHRSTG